MCKPFAEFAGEGCFENFGEALFLDVPEHDLSAVIQAAGDNPSVVENGGVCFEGMACACGVFAGGHFGGLSDLARFRPLES